jgi:hypothetical protein
MLPSPLPLRRLNVLIAYETFQTRSGVPDQKRNLKVPVKTRTLHLSVTSRRSTAKEYSLLCSERLPTVARRHGIPEFVRRLSSSSRPDNQSGVHSWPMYQCKWKYLRPTAMQKCSNTLLREQHRSYHLVHHPIPQPEHDSPSKNNLSTLLPRDYMLFHLGTNLRLLFAATDGRSARGSAEVPHPHSRRL